MDKRKPLIAIVDDDLSVCRALKRLVRSLGLNAETFASGKEFVDCFEAMPSFRADCVILDVQMPGMNGFEVQEWLARSASHIPVIFITAHDEVGVRERAKAAGAVAFLRKPFNDDLLIRTLRVALGKGKRMANTGRRARKSYWPKVEFREEFTAGLPLEIH